jgi:hypothetical protein
MGVGRSVVPIPGCLAAVRLRSCVWLLELGTRVASCGAVRLCRLGLYTYERKWLGWAPGPKSWPFLCRVNPWGKMKLTPVQVRCGLMGVHSLGQKLTGKLKSESELPPLNREEE